MNLPKLTIQQREILVGKLLGDAHLETQTNGRTYRLLIEHTSKKKEYVDHLYEIYKPIVSTPPKEADHYFTVNEVERHSESLRLKTLVHPGFRFYAQLFYKDGVKRIPKNIHKLLTPQVLAYWYMDDGSLKGPHRSGKTLNTQGFTFNDVEILSEALKKCGIENTIQNKNIKIEEKVGDEVKSYTKNYKVIYLTAKGDKVFTELIRPYVLDCFKDKLESKKEEKQ